MKNMILNRSGRIVLSVILAVIFATAASGRAGAAVIELPLDFEYSGGAMPESPSPWATAVFIDTGYNSVALKMSAENLYGTEFISRWYFNFDPALDPGLLNFSISGMPGSMPNSINTGADAFKAGGNGYYDIEFDFPPPKGGFEYKFTSGETVAYDVTYTGAGSINAYSFDFRSSSSAGKETYYSAAHVQSIGSDGEDSGWIGSRTIVPEPVSSILFVFGGASLAYRRYRKKRRTA